GGQPQVLVVTGVRADQAVVRERAGVEGGRHSLGRHSLGARPARSRAHRDSVLSACRRPPAAAPRRPPGPGPAAPGLPCRSHASSAAVTSAKPNRKSSTGMSQGPRSPVTARGAYTTTGALSLVSQPSTGTWKASTISIVSQ